MIRLGIVVPCYNEEEVLAETSRRLLSLLDRLAKSEKISPNSIIYYIDDGSKDKTWSLIEDLSRSHKQVAGIKLSRNCGHQNALIAGLLTVENYDALVSIDADLQDDVDAIEKMLEEHEHGAEIVYGVRDDRTTDSRLKRSTAESFYHLMGFLGADIVHNHADFRLMSKRAIEAFKQYGEINIFIRGVVPLLGFRTSVVYYKRAERFAGKSKYPLKRMIAFAIEGITSFSVVPLRIISVLGLLIFAFSMVMSLYVLGVKLMTDQTVPGWTSTVLPVYLLGGIQILCIGVIGEYLGKTYQETKNRPRYIIEKTVNLSSKT